MYSSGYSAVSKHGLGAQKKKYRSKGKSCGYYMRIVFFFSSLIQSLIIVSLVLFLIYGKKQDAPSVSRIQDLEGSFSRLSLENVDLRQQRKNLTNRLNVTMTEKTRNDWDLLRCKYVSNVSASLIQNLDRDLQKCNRDLMMRPASNPFQVPRQIPAFPPNPNQCSCNCGHETERLKTQIEFLNSNFSTTVRNMRIDEERLSRDRDNLILEAIHLRRDKATLEKALEYSKLNCKKDFIDSLSGVSNVSRVFLQKIESLFVVMPFHISCSKKQERLEQICFNCTLLSREVEDKFQQYLNNVGDQVARIELENSRLKAENERLSSDYRTCSQNRSGMILEHRKNVEKLKMKYDLEKEELILDKKKLIGEMDVLENSVKFKVTEIQHLKQEINLLNSTCKSGGVFGPRQSSPWNNGGGSNSPSLGSTGLGTNSKFPFPGSGLNKPASTGLGSTGIGSTGSNYGANGFGSNRQSSPSLGSTGLGSTGLGSSSTFGNSGTGLNKQSSTGSGSTGYGSTGSSSSYGSAGTGLNKPSSTGSGSTGYGSTGSSSSYGSTGSGLNKQSSTGSGSTGYGSTGSSSSYGSAGTGLNKQSSSSLGSTGFGSTDSGSNKQGSSGLGSTGFGSSLNFGSTGSEANRQSSTGSSSLGVNRLGSTGLSSGSTSSSGTSPNKQASSGRSSFPFGSGGSSSSQSSTGSSSSKETSNAKSSTDSTSKNSRSGFSWFSLGSGTTNSGQSKPSSDSGTGTGRGSSSGSPFGMGRTSGYGGSSVSVAEHLRDLQRIINPSAPQEKPELSRMLG